MIATQHQKIKVKVKENSLRARFAAWKLGGKQVAMVWGNTILLFNTTRQDFLNNKPWVLHELRHVWQVQQMGKWLFLWRYLVLGMRHGYHKHPFEIDARLHEHDETFLEKIEWI